MIIPVIERAQRDLEQLVNIWLNNETSEASDEHFSEEKLLYFMLKSLEALAYCHSQGVYYGDMKPTSIQVFRDYKVKLGDFGLSIKTQLDDQLSYDLVGFTPRYLPSETKKRVDEKNRLSREELWRNDRYALW